MHGWNLFICADIFTDSVLIFGILTQSAMYGGKTGVVSYKSCADKQTKWERTEARKTKVL